MDIASLFKIMYPIVQGAMAHISYPVLAAAVSNAGGLGVMASGGWSAEQLRARIRRCRELTDKPFAVNLMLMQKNISELVDVLIDEGVGIVTTGAGTPKPYMPALKKAGVLVVPVVPSVLLARKMEDIGADAIVAEGTEAGGHVGETTTLCLIPQVVDAVSLPVIAAGGIADGRGMAAAFMLGAKGVQMGTRFLATRECPVHENYKQAILDANDTASIVSGRCKGVPVRNLRGRLVEDYLRLENDPATTLEDLENLAIGGLKRAACDGDMENGSVMAGQIAGMIGAVMSCEEVITTIMRDMRQTGRLTTLP